MESYDDLLDQAVGELMELEFIDSAIDAHLDVKMEEESLAGSVSTPYSQSSEEDDYDSYVWALVRSRWSLPTAWEVMDYISMVERGGQRFAGLDHQGLPTFYSPEENGLQVWYQ